MDLTLIIGYVCNIYKKPPSIRIFLNDFFIDEFECKNTISHNELKFYKLNSKYIFEDKHEFLDPKHISATSLNINHNVNLKYYSLQNLPINNESLLCVRIEVNNNDSNYTNGFITKSTMVSFPIISLLSTKTFQNWNKFSKSYLLRLEKLRKKHQDIRSIKNYYSKKSLFSVIRPENFIFYENDGKKYIYSHMCGGSGKFEIKFYKKYFNIICDKSLGVKRLGQQDYISGLLNKYLEYENQRSNNS